MKRNLIHEITAIKSRAEFSSRYDLNVRLNDIEHAFNEMLNYSGEYDTELIKYIPIATVACLEAFFRSSYKELIDFGHPFSNNVTKFNQSRNVKFDFDIVNAIQTKTVTVGEFISHILPCNNFEDIDSNMTTIIGTDFCSELKKFTRKGSQTYSSESSKIFKKNSNQIISDIQRTFELRHIFCHEFATNLKIDKTEILRCYSNCKHFLNHTNDFIWETIYPDSPETTLDMINQCKKEFKNSESELTKLITEIKKAKPQDAEMGLNSDLFDKTLQQWKLYRKTKAVLDASVVKGGSLYPVVYSTSMTATTKEKIQSLKNEFEIDLRRYNYK